jgi:tetratricopeptide (TPR) repeat protein
VELLLVCRALSLCYRSINIRHGSSAAYLKLEDYARARRDADMCIQLDKHWAKGYWRRGQAQLEDQDYYGARDTFKQGLEFCERDDNLVRGLENAEIRIQVVEKVQGPADGTATDRFDINGTTPAPAPARASLDGAPKAAPSPDDPKFPGSAEEEIKRISAAPNHYAVLHVSPDSSPAEMKKNYHLLARMLHPDKCQLQGASEAMSQVSLAYDTLTHVVKRTLYDQYVSQATGSADGNTKTYAEWEATQQPVDLPKWLKWILGIKGCGWIIAVIVFLVMLPFAIVILVIFIILWLIFLPYRLTLRHCFPERYARLKEEAERERAKMEELAQDRQFPAV